MNLPFIAGALTEEERSLVLQFRLLSPDGKEALQSCAVALRSNMQQQSSDWSAASAVAVRLEAQARRLAAEKGKSLKAQRIAGFWKDEPVRNRCINMRGKLGLNKATQALRKEFGSRAPGRSTLHRFWQKLDGAA